ncbi:hypothetical protein RFI_13936, partial [Reticulomyxa filosa]
IPIWNSKSSSNSLNPIIWDYHVIGLYLHPSNWSESVILDVDSRLSFPCKVGTFVEGSFQPQLVESQPIPKKWKHQFRCIPAQQYLNTFYSDRSHMLDLRDKTKKTYLSTPPTYPCILLEGMKNGTNLMKEFVDMKNRNGIGFVTDLDGFINFVKNFKQQSASKAK